MSTAKIEEILDGDSVWLEIDVDDDLVDPAIWPKLIAWLATLPVVEEDEVEDIEPFV